MLVVRHSIAEHLPGVFRAVSLCSLVEEYTKVHLSSSFHVNPSQSVTCGCSTVLPLHSKETFGSVVLGPLNDVFPFCGAPVIQDVTIVVVRYDECIHE